MKGTIKEQRSNHDAHDLLLGILYYFPENAKWDELSFHEALYKISKNYKVLKFLKFKELSGNLYCEDLGKVFDLLELSNTKATSGNIAKNVETTARQEYG